MTIQELLAIAIEQKASDLHLIVGIPPMLRIDGVLVPVANTVALTDEQVQALVFGMISEEQKEIILVNKELDYSLPYQESARFRVNVYHQKGNLAASLRLLPRMIPTIDALNLPKICHSFVTLKQGLILVTGPTGHGKSTSLAAMIQEINQNRSEHIVTIEDPIEYVFQPQKSIISQREIRSDTHSWQIALRSCLREDPNIVMIGEMRDFETISSALTIAETGHLVFATLHTNSASQSIDRIVDVFPEYQQGQVRMQLSATLEAILSQRLLPSLDGGRIPASEILISTPAVKTTIREGKSHLLDNIIQTSSELGMQTLEMDLSRLVHLGKIDLETAKTFAFRPEELMRLIKMK